MAFRICKLVTGILGAKNVTRGLVIFDENNSLPLHCLLSRVQYENLLEKGGFNLFFDNQDVVGKSIFF